MEEIQKIITLKCIRFILGAVATSFVFLPLSQVKLPSLCVCLRTETNQQKGQKFCFGPGGSDGKASAYNAGDPGLIPGSGRSSGEGNGNPLQYSCLKNPMDGGAWGRKESYTTEQLHSLTLLWPLLSDYLRHLPCNAEILPLLPLVASSLLVQGPQSFLQCLFCLSFSFSSSSVKSTVL